MFYAMRRPPIVNVVRLDGVIGKRSLQGQSLNIAALDKTIERAFSKKPAAVAMAINSPGGTPVQAHLIARRFRALADERRIPLFAFVEDAGASGGYLLACAADEIFADASSIVGSIGVVGAGFGLDRFIAKHDIDRRIYTSGDRKSILDPFRPEQEDDLRKIADIQHRIHEEFSEFVRVRRGDKLKGGDLFNGEFWVGREALSLGLIDGIGGLHEIMRRKYGAKTRLQQISAKRRLHLPFPLSWLKERWADDLTEAVITAAESRLLWSRLGL